MNALAAWALITGIALLVAALVITFAATSTTPTDRAATIHLRAADALDTLRPGTDDQWVGMTAVVPHIRDLANAENAVAIPTDPERTGP